MNYEKRPLWQWVLIYLVAAVVVYGAVYYFVLRKNGGYNSSSSQTYTSPAQQTQQQTLPQQNQSLNPIQPPANAQNIITYTDSGFSPSTLTVKKGDTVIFKNTASDDMRVASNPHPRHNGYPTTGGCVSSTFDSCSDIKPDTSWSFTFDIVGTWGFHNHLNPSEGGTIVVQ